MERQWVVGGRSYYVSRSQSGETEGVKAEWKLGEREGEREGERGSEARSLAANTLKPRIWQNVTWMAILETPLRLSPLSSSNAMSEKTATRNPSLRGKCKEKQETVREWVLVLNKSLSLAFFEWVLKIPSWQSAHGSWMEMDKRGAEVGGMSIVFVLFLSVLAF